MKYDLSFIQTDNPLRAYFLGLWLSDGWMDKSTIRISSSDSQIINDLASATNFTNKIFTQYNRKFSGSSEYSGTIQYTICYSNKELYKWFISLGYTRKKTGYEFIPSCISNSTFPHFLRGITDGDGTFLITNGRLRWSLVSASSDFLQQILIKISPILSTKSRVNVSGACFSIAVGHSDSVRLGNYIYKNAEIKLERKYKIYKSGLELPKRSTRQSWSRQEIELLQSGVNPYGRSYDQCYMKRWHLKYAK